ncbi:hypothetical protein HPB47_000221, partial [Ixodes persulcatus]
TWPLDLYAHGNLNKLGNVAEQLKNPQLTRLLAIKAGQALKKSGTYDCPHHNFATATSAMGEAQRRAYHADAHERHVEALDSRRHVVYYTDAASGSVPTHGAPPASTAWVNITHPHV